jgi:epoxyqueuosine reductase
MPTSTSECRRPRSASHARTRAAGGLKALIVREADRLGLDAVRATTPDAMGPAGDRLLAFVAEGRHGDMEWMARAVDRRADPRRLWPGVRSIVMVGLSYAPSRDPLEALGKRLNGAISAYAQGRDYHDILKGKLKRLGSAIAGAAACEVKVFVDTGPLMEKPLAEAAGIGWQGKHTNLVSRQGGSWLFLGAILTEAEIEPDAAEEDHCGRCRRCLDACPTAAFPAPYQIDARRCISYLTIEHKGHIAREFRVPMGNRIFGCDDCLAVCPWNKFAVRAREMRLSAGPGTDNPPLADLLGLDEAAFRKRFAGTPVKRTGRDRFIRNVLIAAGNSGERSLLPQVMALLDDTSPLVRAMAVWALRRLGDPGRVAQPRERSLAREQDESVRGEWLAESAS